MPIKVPDNLPAKDILLKENIFVMDEGRAFSQDIRPLKIAVLNLMPLKQETEVQILRLLGNTPLQIEVSLLHMQSHVSKNTPKEYLSTFYRVFNDIKNQHYDGMLITGAPIENLEFEQVDYWRELQEIFEWTNTNVTSTLFTCWGAQAGLYHFYGVPKYPLPAKMFGVFLHKVLKSDVKLLRGFDDVFYAPHSRHTEIKECDLQIDGLSVLSTSASAGVYLAASDDGRRVFITGHPEYDPETLKREYERDLAKNLPISIPKNYFMADNPKGEISVRWRSHANLLYSNWLNYYVYQETPY